VGGVTTWGLKVHATAHTWVKGERTRVNLNTRLPATTKSQASSSSRPEPTELRQKFAPAFIYSAQSNDTNAKKERPDLHLTRTPPHHEAIFFKEDLFSTALGIRVKRLMLNCVLDERECICAYDRLGVCFGGACMCMCAYFSGPS
jgi:hypothetical protein